MLTIHVSCLLVLSSASTFDFPEFGADSESDKVEHVDSANASDLAVFQRERAFSFEFFNFAGDELLPAAPVSEDTADHQLPDQAVSGFMGLSDMEPIHQRPRGDSIIFDPVSFQDGGIHEKNALLKARTASIGSATDALLLENKLSTANAGYVSLSKSSAFRDAQPHFSHDRTLTFVILRFVESPARRFLSQLILRAMYPLRLCRTTAAKLDKHWTIPPRTKLPRCPAH